MNRLAVLLLLCASLRLALPILPEPEPRPIRLGMLVVMMDLIAGMMEEPSAVQPTKEGK